MQLWLPTGVVKERCRICAKPFFEGEERSVAAHVAVCGMEYAREHSKRVKNPGLFDPTDDSLIDREYEAWVMRHGRVR